jgi:protein-L-isoaspartate(D-aspartate) O-methyltransferase
MINPETGKTMGNFRNRSHHAGFKPPRRLRLGGWLPLIPLVAAAMILLWVGFPQVSLADAFEEARLGMVANQLRARGITDGKVLSAMSRIPRHLFVPDGLRSQSYEDHPLPIGEGQTISQPYVVALMTQALNIRPGERVLEIGTGSGYQAAVLSELTDQVYTIEIRPNLADQARDRLKHLGYTKVKVRQGDGYFGWPGEIRFDAIMITAAVNHIPPPLLNQLKPRGRLILPLGDATFFQTLTLVTKRVEEPFDVRHLTTVRFVPMTGKAQK